MRLPYRNPKLPVDASHERFCDQNRCILCTRCVRVCDEIEGAHVWDVMGRGIDSQVITDLMQPWGESETCTRCGKCVNVCPTGALFDKGKSGADIPSIPILPYLNMMREGRMSKMQTWQRSGWTAARDATCPSSTWTNGCSSSRPSSTWSSARWSTSRIYPEKVDVALVEGAVSSVEDEHKIRHIRAHTSLLVAMGDCAVTGNVPAMRNPFGPLPILDRAYHQNACAQPQTPCNIVPALLDKVRPCTSCGSGSVPARMSARRRTPSSWC